MSSIENGLYPWINHALIQKVLISSKGATSNLIDFQLYDAVGKGENYTSHMVRISVQYNDQNEQIPKKTAFVVKTTLSKEIHEMIEKNSLFARELAVYRDILPKFDEYTKFIDPIYKCSPRCFATNENPIYFLFEDLRENKYRNTDRTVGLNFEMSEILFVKLAKFHAVATMIYDKNPELFVHHRKSMFGPDTADILETMTAGVHRIQEKCINWPGYEHYAEKLTKLAEVLWDRVADTYKFDPNTFNTLTHGDLWVNNIMYKFDEENKPIDVIMVDFQIGCYGPPAIDVSYLLYTSTTNEMFEEDWDRLIQIYHTELVKSLKAANYTKHIPTLTELHIECLKRSMYSVLVAFNVLGPRFMTSESMIDSDIMAKDADAYKRITNEIFEQPKLIERAKYLLDYFDRKGFLDV